MICFSSPQGETEWEKKKNECHMKDKKSDAKISNIPQNKRNLNLYGQKDNSVVHDDVYARN
jgi:hypothetical protein